MARKKELAPESGTRPNDAIRTGEIPRKPKRQKTEGDRGPSPSHPCFAVAIGASAGGQEALEQLFTVMPPDCGLSFVVVMHLPPDGPSFLAGMLGRYTTMAVVTAEDGMPLLPNRVQVIPAGMDLTLHGGRLHLEEPDGSHHPVDRLFRSLAADASLRSVAVVLSGSGTDGAAGARAIKESGGTVLVQDPGSALYPGMPESVIAAGAADLVLPAEDIPLRLAEIAHGTCRLTPPTCQPASLDDELQTIFSIVKERTGHDFSSYKANTVVRRIERRMAVHEIGGLGKYVALLKEKPQEAHALGQDILIGVTSFFRDPEAFEVVRRKVIPLLLDGREAGQPVRVWHACCATGEEVYSMAILVREFLEEHQLDVRVQLFATDIDEASIAQARAGLYPGGIEEEVGEERLRNFFAMTDGRHYRVAKQLREMVVFAHHSLVKDPPFSRLDLIVCRNFLIYLNTDMQKRIIDLFHQVLKPGGFLFLGASETVGRHSDLFAPIDKKWRIYQRQETARRTDVLFPFAAKVPRLPGLVRPARPAGAAQPAPGSYAEKFLVERYAPPCVVVNEQYEVVYFSTRTSRFLEPPVGEPTLDIIRMAREELRPSLRAAIHKAFADQKQVVFRGVKLSHESGEELITIQVEPIDAPSHAGRLATVVFEPATVAAATPPMPSGEWSMTGGESSQDALVRMLEENLRIAQEQLKVTIEQLETSNEGFMSTNEELITINEEYQATNEELQATNEELETSKEELQALNEELATVNVELQGMVEEAKQASADLENLFVSSEIATIFLDRRLKIKRFSPAMARIFNLIPADIGRPFRHLKGTIDWPDLSGDAGSVLDTLVPMEREVTALADGRNFLMRVLPYRTAAETVDGVVVTLVDISELRHLEAQTRHLASFPEVNPNPVMEVDTAGLVKYCNPAARRILTKLGMDGSDSSPLIPPDLAAILAEWDQERESTHLREVAVGDRVFNQTIQLTPQFKVARIYAQDITARKRAEEAVQRAKDEWERTFDSVPDLIAIMDDKHRVVRANRAMAERLGTTPEHCVESFCFSCVHDTDQPPDFCPHARSLADGRIHTVEAHLELLGGDFVISTVPLFDGHGVMTGSVHIARDITERKRAERVLQHAAELRRLALESAGMGAWDYRFDSGDVTWDERCREMWGIREGSRIDYAAAIDRIHPDDRAATDEAVKQALAGVNGGGYHHEFRVVWQDGTTHWIASHGRVYFEGEGEERRAVRFIGANQEITQKKLAEEALRRYELLAGQSRDIILFVRRDDGRILEANAAAMAAYGYGRDELLAMSVHSLRAADSLELTAAHMAEADTHGLLFETVHRRRDGSTFPVEVNSQGATIGGIRTLISVIRDITDRKRADEALRESELFYRQTLESIPGMVFTTRPDGYCDYQSQQWVDFTGVPMVEHLGDGWNKLLHPDDRPRAYAAWQAAVADRAPYDLEYRVRRHDGEYEWFKVRGRPIRNAAGEIVRWFGTALNIDHLLKAQEALRESEERVRRKLDSILAPDEDMGNLELADIIDARAMQSLMDNFYKLTRMPMAMIDLNGKVLVGVGWQDVCTKFHRIHPETCKNCIESDTLLSAGIPPGEFKLYKCKNNMWDVATPIMVGGRQFGNFFMGQFFFEDEPLDYEFYRCQARQYGFEENEYIAALESAPRLSRESLTTGMAYFMELAEMISRMSYSNLKLARSMAERDTLMDSLQKAHDELERRVEERTEELASAINVLQEEIVGREKAEESIRRLNLLYAVLSETNQAIVRASDRDALFRDFCRIAVEHGGFLLSWVGLVNEESGEVRMAAASGATGYLDEIRTTSRKEPAGEGPTGIAIRQGTYCICNDFQNDPCTHPWHDKGRAYGIRASASIALKQEGRVLGALTLYADTKDFFNQQQVELLLQVGADISFALDNLDREARRREAEAALQKETMERLQTLELLRTKEQMLIQQSRLAAMGEMIGNIAHQWRQPLNALGLTIQQLEVAYECGGFSKEQFDASVAKAMEIVYHMSQTIDDFRNFYRPDKEKNWFVISQLLRKVVSLVEANFREDHIAIEIDGSDDLEINGYPNEYAQVLLNILVNARDAFLERETGEPRILVSYRQAEGKSVVTVTDNAGGIPEEIMGKIFDPYFTTKAQGLGTGVGLFMSKTIIEKNMGGRLTAANVEGGAEFRIEV